MRSLVFGIGLVLFAAFPFDHVYSQADTLRCIIKKTSFSSKAYDEFAPSWYRDMLVFSSNRDKNALRAITDSMNIGKISMYVIDTVPGTPGRKVELFGEELRTRLNDGPATFNKSGDKIIFSRNQFVEGRLRRLSASRNKLGLFTSVLEDGIWKNVTGLRFNSEWYNTTTPGLSPDGSQLFFASDRPGGFGGADLYYSVWEDGYWHDPVNLGPLINTEGNESYPFMSESGELYFTSDYYSEGGDKDIYITRQGDSRWDEPVRLPYPFNTVYNDFGIIADPAGGKGYLSSDRSGNLDIYSFENIDMPVFFSQKQSENRFCYFFNDTGSIEIDPDVLRYEWKIGGRVFPGDTVTFCFPGPGEYEVEFNILDKESGELVFNKLKKKIILLSNIQPFISSEDELIAGEEYVFDGSLSYCPGYYIEGYNWDFGGQGYGSGKSTTFIFNDEGSYRVKLGLLLRSYDSTKMLKKSIYKDLRVYSQDDSRMKDRDTGKGGKYEIIEDLDASRNISVANIFSSEEIFRQDAVFQVELLRTGARPGKDYFSDVPSKYSISEVFNNEDSTYSYITNEQMSLMSVYRGYVEIKKLGYSDASIRLIQIRDEPTRVLYRLKKRFGIQSDLYFDENNRLKSNAFLMLNQLTLLMNKYPGVKLEISAHTDSRGDAARNLQVSMYQAQVIADYLIEMGVVAGRIDVRGFGELYPVASNVYSRGRMQNRRIDFRIVSDNRISDR